MVIVDVFRQLINICRADMRKRCLRDRCLATLLTAFPLMLITLLCLSTIRRSIFPPFRQEREFEWRLKGPLQHNDTALLSVVRRDFLDPPSTRPYALMRDRSDYEAGVYNSYLHIDPEYSSLQKIIRKVFDGQFKGFFVEAGAVDGEFLSNTLQLERDLGWTGLLVEADGDMYRLLLGKHRRAWSSHACLSPKPFPHIEVLIKYTANAWSQPGTSMYSRGHGVLSSAEGSSPLRVVGGDLGNSVPLYETVQCLPLASLLLALNVSHVHFVSLDVEGAEPKVLEFFPFEEIRVDVWLVEHIVKSHHSTKLRQEASHDESNSVGDQNQIDSKFVDFFSVRGYELFPMDTKGLQENYLFVRKESETHRRLKNKHYF